jgi:hypothetical protein
VRYRIEHVIIRFRYLRRLRWDELLFDVNTIRSKVIHVWVFVYIYFWLFLILELVFWSVILRVFDRNTARRLEILRLNEMVGRSDPFK